MMTPSNPPSSIPPPKVLHPLTLPSLLTLLLSYHPSPITAIICRSRTSFIHQLLTHDAHASKTNSPQVLNPPTLDSLVKSSTTTLLFCDSLQSLQALLSIYPLATPPSDDQQRPTNHPVATTLLLIYPLQLHAHTSAHSVQGVSRTIASAVEASLRAQAALVIVEPVGQLTGATATAADDNEDKVEVPDEDPWMQHVPMLSPSASKFAAAERAWVGRTVALRRVVGRWCVFERVGGSGDGAVKSELR